MKIRKLILPCLFLFILLLQIHFVISEDYTFSDMACSPPDTWVVYSPPPPASPTSGVWHFSGQIPLPSGVCVDADSITPTNPYGKVVGQICYTHASGVGGPACDFTKTVRYCLPPPLDSICYDLPECISPLPPTITLSGKGVYTSEGRCATSGVLATNKPLEYKGETTEAHNNYNNNGLFCWENVQDWLGGETSVGFTQNIEGIGYCNTCQGGEWDTRSMVIGSAGTLGFKIKACKYDDDFTDDSTPEKLPKDGYCAYLRSGYKEEDIDGSVICTPRDKNKGYSIYMAPISISHGYQTLVKFYAFSGDIIGKYIQTIVGTGGGGDIPSKVDFGGASGYGEGLNCVNFNRDPNSAGIQADSDGRILFNNDAQLGKYNIGIANGFLSAISADPPPAGSSRVGTCSNPVWSLAPTTPIGIA